MSPTKKAQKAAKNRSKPGKAWKNLSRDSSGRWVKGSGTKSPKKAPKKKVKQAKKKVSSEKGVTAALDQIKEDFGNICPRCSGDMKFHNVRCGPERLIKVKKCNICNFWLPIQK